MIVRCNFTRILYFKNDSVVSSTKLCTLKESHTVMRNTSLIIICTVWHLQCHDNVFLLPSLCPSSLSVPFFPCISLFLSVFVSLHLSLALSPFLCVFLSLCVCLSLSLSIRLSVFPCFFVFRKMYPMKRLEKLLINSNVGLLHCIVLDPPTSKRAALKTPFRHKVGRIKPATPPPEHEANEFDELNDGRWVAASGTHPCSCCIGGLTRYFPGTATVSVLLNWCCRDKMFEKTERRFAIVIHCAKSVMELPVIQNSRRQAPPRTLQLLTCVLSIQRCCRGNTESPKSLPWHSMVSTFRFPVLSIPRVSVVALLWPTMIEYERILTATYNGRVRLLAVSRLRWLENSFTYTTHLELFVVIVQRFWRIARGRMRWCRVIHLLNGCFLLRNTNKRSSFFCDESEWQK